MFCSKTCVIFLTIDVFMNQSFNFPPRNNLGKTKLRIKINILHGSKFHMFVAVSQPEFHQSTRTFFELPYRSYMTRKILKHLIAQKHCGKTPTQDLWNPHLRHCPPLFTHITKAMHRTTDKNSNDSIGQDATEYAHNLLGLHLLQTRLSLHMKHGSFYFRRVLQK